MEYSNPVLMGFSEAGQDLRNAHNGLMEALIQSSRNTNAMLLQAQQNFYQNQTMNLGLNPRTYEPLNGDWRSANVNQVDEMYRENQRRVSSDLPGRMPQQTQQSSIKNNSQGATMTGDALRNIFSTQFK